MTIFGFNTDVKHGDTVYHVQSEARAGDLLVQTLVFVKGLCVGKRTSSYAQDAAQPGFSDQAIHELLKTQHRAVIDAINAGKLESALGPAGEVQDIGTAGLSLKWVRADSIGVQDRITMYFQVTDAGRPVSGAQLVARLAGTSDSSVLARAASDDAGNVEMPIPITEELRRELAIIIHATHAGKSATRKLRLKARESSDRA